MCKINQKTHLKKTRHWKSGWALLHSLVLNAATDQSESSIPANRVIIKMHKNMRTVTQPHKNVCYKAFLKL